MAFGKKPLTAEQHEKLKDTVKIAKSAVKLPAVASTVAYPAFDSFQEHDRKQKEAKAAQEQLNVLAGTIDALIAGLVNSTYLKDLPKEKHLTKQDIQKSAFSKQLVTVLDHYFPDGKYDNPLVGLAMSALVLGTAINSKKPIEIKRKLKKNEPKKEDSGNGRAADSSGTPAQTTLTNAPGPMDSAKN